MVNYKAILQYEGTRYRGWQTQGNTDNTIQGKLEALLTRMEGEPVEVHGSGRTDAGVHAAGQVINFRSSCGKSTSEIRDYMNQYLPEDIAVLSVEEAAPRFHARLNAVRKTYAYRIWNSPIQNVFERKILTQVEEPLDVEAMQKAASYLEGEHDFKSFCSVHAQVETTVRTIYACIVSRREDEIYIRVTGNGFLYNMVRIIAGTLIEVGAGKRQPEDIIKMLEATDRQSAGPTAPAHGLTMIGISYE